ncbi:MAG: glycosyltransferase family 2 protein [Thiomonas sp.]
MAAWLLWVSIALLLYTYFGYPALVALWARLAPRPVAASPHYRPRLAMIVVARNEVARIRAKIETCLAQDYPPDRLRVLIVSDGSTDGMDDVVRGFASPRVGLLAFPLTRGKAACLNDAIASCDEEVLVLTDARQRLNPEAVRHLTANLADPQVGAVSGELVFVAEDANAFASGVSAYWRYEKFIRRSQAAIHSVPGVTGALYALRKSCFRPIPPSTILDDVAIPMQAAMQGRRVVFESRALAYDTPSTEARQERRRKVRTLAGNFQLLLLYPQLLLPWRNPIFIQFVSHKLLRLLAPWAMSLALLSNVALALHSTFYAALLALQLAFYALPLLGALVPACRNCGLVKLATTFIALNGYAMLGFFEFLTNRNAHLWRAGPATTPERPQA